MNTRGVLGGYGEAKASIVVPAVPSAVGVVLHHAFLMYESAGFHLPASPTTLLAVR